MAKRAIGGSAKCCLCCLCICPYIPNRMLAHAVVTCLVGSDKLVLVCGAYNAPKVHPHAAARRPTTQDTGTYTDRQPHCAGHFQSLTQANTAHRTSTRRTCDADRCCVGPPHRLRRGRADAGQCLCSDNLGQDSPKVSCAHGIRQRHTAAQWPSLKGPWKVRVEGLRHGHRPGDSGQSHGHRGALALRHGSATVAVSRGRWSRGRRPRPRHARHLSSGPLSTHS